MNLRTIAPNQYVIDATVMRSNSVMKDKSWIARITGLHPKFVFEREFVTRERDQPVPTSDGTQTFGPLVEGEIYEYREIAATRQSGYSYSRHGGYSGFFRIVNGEIENIEKAVALAMLQKPKPQTPAESNG